MTDTTNRVLSIDEVMALEEGRAVYVEEHSHSKYRSARDYGHYVKRVVKAFKSDCVSYGVYWRVWSLPQPPTPEEMERNPWRKEGEASE